MTYKELAQRINSMPDELQNTDVTIYLHHIDEFYPAVSLKYTDESQDVLDPQHPYITLHKG